MHEFFALLFFAGATKMTLTGGFWGVMGILVGACSIFYFALSVTARFNKMGRWFRINPGVPTPMNEREWEALGDKATAEGIAKKLLGKSAARRLLPRPANPPATRQMPEMSYKEMKALARQPQKFPERLPVTAELHPVAKAQPEEVIYYDSGYEDMGVKKPSSSKGVLEKQFDAIFNVKEDAS